MWNGFEGVFILVFVFFISSASSSDRCDVYQLPIGSKLTKLCESFNLEENFWINPQPDFERIEVHLKVNNIFTINPSYYLLKHVVIGSSSILEPSYYTEQNWIPLKIEIFRKVVFIGQDRMILRATVNKTMIYQLDDNLWWTQYTYQKYKLLAKGGLSISKCDPLQTTTEAPTKLQTTIKAPTKFQTTTETPIKLRTTSVNPLPNDDSTKTYKERNDEKYETKTLADILKEDRKYSLIILLITIVLLTIILISAICFILCRKKRVNEEQESIYETESSMRHFVPEGHIPPPVPPPTYSSMYPNLDSSEGKKNSEEMNKESPYEVPKRSYSNPYVENQYLEMSKIQY